MYQLIRYVDWMSQERKLRLIIHIFQGFKNSSRSCENANAIIVTARPFTSYIPVALNSPVSMVLIYRKACAFRQSWDSLWFNSIIGVIHKNLVICMTMKTVGLDSSGYVHVCDLAIVPNSVALGIARLWLLLSHFILYGNFWLQCILVIDTIKKIILLKRVIQNCECLHKLLHNCSYTIRGDHWTWMRHLQT